MKNRRKILMVMVVAGVVYMGGMVLRGYGAQDPLQPAIAEKILRFHVLANSDSEEDQNLKKKVRDAVGSYIEPYLEDADSIGETRQIVGEHMEEIVDTAQEVVVAEGYDYKVKAEIARTDFPVKTYGDYTFPAGEYEALKVTIGEGAGHNWWCVLYPNMCFRGSVYEIVEKDAGEALQEVLSPEEYEDVFQSGRFRIRFKLFEMFR